MSTLVPVLRRLPRATVVALVLVAACTTTTITPELVQKPPEAYDTVVIGEIASADELIAGRLPYFRQGLQQRLLESGAFRRVLESKAQPAPESAIVVSGEITEVEKGSKALRFLIGFGAGKAYAEGTFEVHDSAGARLARFVSRKAYSGGAGIGGMDLVDMDDLVSQLGEETANSIVRWSRGEPLAEPEREPGQSPAAPRLR